MSSENQQQREEYVPLSIKALPKKVFADVTNNENHTHNNRHYQRPTTLKLPIPWELSRHPVGPGTARFGVVEENERQPQHKYHQKGFQDVLALHVVPDEHQKKNGQRKTPEDEFIRRSSYQHPFFICTHLFPPFTRSVK